MSAIGEWYKCVGCGGQIGFFSEGYSSGGHTLSPGAVAHVKPDHLIGVPNSVPCALYRDLEPEELYALHRARGSRIESPESLVPFAGGGKN